ncbi:DUF2381 family protein [Archangium violaceum]|uniref:DUF2381 family protein n=1 Tax=Archangium violaceum Cb vi76 TaxID=1406225 RepID=A0A084SEP5_9BACT|nr:DUF2381 family protein [Archangium violaceum]KFA86930.1 hypothetical protein Q664_52115 [Archangium violaceum Cb vi76]
MMNRTTLRTLFQLSLLLLPLAAGVASARSSWLPEGWQPEDRELRLYERPSASEREVRVTRRFLSVVELMDGQVDLERTTLEGAGERIRLKQQDGNLLLVDVVGDLEPGERLPLSVAYRDGQRLELTLVRGELRTDLSVRVYQRPPPTKEEQEAALAASLAGLTLDYEEHEHLLKGRMTCSPEEVEAPRVGGSGVQESRFRCEPVPHDCGFKLPAWLHRRESAGRLTINGVEGGGGKVGMMGNSISYWMPYQTVVVLSVFNMDPNRRWRPGEYALRREATGETVRLLAMKSEVPEEGVEFGEVGLMSFVIDLPSSGTERFALEVLEKDGGPRRIRVEGITFEKPGKETPAR